MQSRTKDQMSGAKMLPRDESGKGRKGVGKALWQQWCITTLTPPQVLLHVL